MLVFDSACAVPHCLARGMLTFLLFTVCCEYNTSPLAEGWRRQGSESSNIIVWGMPRDIRT